MDPSRQPFLNHGQPRLAVTVNRLLQLEKHCCQLPRWSCTRDDQLVKRRAIAALEDDSGAPAKLNQAIDARCWYTESVSDAGVMQLGLDRFTREAGPEKLDHAALAPLEHIGARASGELAQADSCAIGLECDHVACGAIAVAANARSRHGLLYETALAMPTSIFSGLSLVRRAARIEITYPNRIHDATRAQRIAQQHGIEVRPASDDTWFLSYPAAAAEYPQAMKLFFAELNDLPRPYVEPEPVAAAGAPLVSCIIVINENLPFVREQLLPSLAVNSIKHSIEIVVVCNGSLEFGQPLDRVRAIRSPWGEVAAAYNAGARVCEGEYLAIFHDDCMVCDPLWIEKGLQRLQRGAHAVAGEYRTINRIADVEVPELPVAKCVPLLLRKAEFEAAGGFDEYHYIGYEDLDFTLALASRGRKLVATNIAVQHFHGMSSTLKYHPVPGLRELFALAALPRGAIMQRFKEFWSAELRREGNDALRRAMDAQLLYVLRKYREFLSRNDRGAYAQAQQALEREFAASGAPDPDRALARFRELDRELCDEAARPG